LIEAFCGINHANDFLVPFRIRQDLGQFVAALLDEWNVQEVLLLVGEQCEIENVHLDQLTEKVCAEGRDSYCTHPHGP